MKHTKKKDKTYIAIYESFYNPGKKETAHKTFKSLGSVETLMGKGCNDPIAFYQREVDKMNFERAIKNKKNIK